MSKQDRVYTRTAADLERKYKLGTPSNGGGDSQEVSKLSQLLSQFMTSVNQKISTIETKLKNIGKPSAEDVSYTSSSLSATNVQDAIDELEEELEQKGDGGIYIGSGEMPEDCNVQIDPNGEIEEYVLKSVYDAKVAELESTISEQNKNFEWKLLGSATGTTDISLKNLDFNEISIDVKNTKSENGWYDSSLIVPKHVLIKRKMIVMPGYYSSSADSFFVVCRYDAQNESIGIQNYSRVNGAGSMAENIIGTSKLEIYYR